jgi:hypothetical protein
MTYHLTPEQSRRWEEGFWAAWRTEEDVLEDLGRQHVHEPVVVLLDDGRTAFAITAGEVQS